jgi:hypothetical protein
MRALLALAGVCALLSGCAVGGNGSECALGYDFSTSPASATADHAAAPPGNQQQFTSGLAPTAPAGCPVPQWVARVDPAWSSSDPIDIQISSADDATNGTAVCLGPTDGAATLTATFVYASQTLTSKSTLTCK